MRKFIANLLFILALVVIVASIPVGIWYDPYPFWKVVGTCIFVMIMCLFIHK